MKKKDIDNFLINGLRPDFLPNKYFLNLLQKNNNESHYHIEGYEVPKNGDVRNQEECILTRQKVINVLKGTYSKKRFAIWVYHKPTKITYLLFWLPKIQEYVVLRTKGPI